MAKSELYILIAVFLFLTVALVWTGAKTWLDMHKRKQNKQSHRNKNV